MVECTTVQYSIIRNTEGKSDLFDFHQNLADLLHSYRMVRTILLEGTY